MSGVSGREFSIFEWGTKLMTTLRILAAAVAAAGFMAAPANATTFIFKSGGAFLDTPTGNVAMDCGTIGADLCTDDDSLGFTYSKSGTEFTATAYVYDGMDREAVQLIQDISPENSGLAALSEMDPAQDQTQFDSMEAVEFVFNSAVFLTNIEFNAGDDNDCSGPNAEGPCGDFDLFIDGAYFATITAVDLLTDVFFGTIFEFRAVTEGAGFTIAQFEVSDVPIPGAIPLLLSGLAGLGFAARRRKAS